MNEWVKKGIPLLAVACLTFAVTGCSGEKVMDKVLEKTCLTEGSAVGNGYDIT